jgi:hypothetical protein
MKYLVRVAIPVEDSSSTASAESIGNAVESIKKAFPTATLLAVQTVEEGATQPNAVR